MLVLTLGIRVFASGGHADVTYRLPPVFEDFGQREAIDIMKDVSKMVRAHKTEIRAAAHEFNILQVDDTMRREVWMTKSGALLDGLTAGLRKKHGMTQGFWKAFRAAASFLEQQRHPDMEEAVNVISEIVLDQPGPTFLGRVKELHEYATEFLNLDADLKVDAVAAASKLGTKLRKKSMMSRAIDVDRYVEIMKGFVEHKARYFEILGEKLSVKLRVVPTEGKESAEWMDTSRRLNVFCEFLNRNEVERLMGRIEEERNNAGAEL